MVYEGARLPGREGPAAAVSGLKLTRFELNLTRFDLKLNRFDPKLNRFDLKLTRFDPNLTRFDLNLTRFDLNLTSFDPNLTVFDPSAGRGGAVCGVMYRNVGGNYAIYWGNKGAGGERSGAFV
jgi:hypothetical protein